MLLSMCPPLFWSSSRNRPSHRTSLGFRMRFFRILKDVYGFPEEACRQSFRFLWILQKIPKIFKDS